jgi:uncharacterized membrane protein
MHSSRRARRTALALVAVLALAYPFAVYFGLQVFNPAVVALGLALLMSVRLLMVRGNTPFLLASWIAIAGLLSALAVSPMDAVRLYPVLVSLALAAVFALSLYYPPSVIERVARLREPDLPPSAVAYTRKVTVLWLGFFLVNAAIAGWTALEAPLELWTFYNGFLAYVLIAVLFAGELLVRRWVRTRK